MRKVILITGGGTFRLNELKTHDFGNVLIFAHGGVLACARVYAGLCDLRHAFENLIPFGGILCIEI